MTNNPQQIIDQSPMGKLQIFAVFLCILLNALDGFDVLAISFASPGIAEEWSVNRAELGIILSMELFGMALGSMLLGGVADKIGRRPTILACLVVMTSGMYLASVVNTVNTLLAIRFITGLGIGGMLAAINAMAAEYSNAKHRSFAIIVMAVGYPVGIILGGSVASYLLSQFDWRSVFIFGATVTGVLLPIVYFFMPESISWLMEKRPAGALVRINKTLKRMGHQTVESLPEPVVKEKTSNWTELFSPTFMRTTILLTLAYFLHIMVFYFVLKWIPKIVVDMGYSAASAGSVLVWANVGGATGSLLLGFLSHKIDVKRLVIGALILSTVMVVIFGQGQSELNMLALVTAAAGFFTNAVIVGQYALIAHSYPARLRAGGTGFVVGLGRGGAALGPVVAGFLFEAGYGLSNVAMIVSVGSLIAAAAIFMLQPPKEEAANA